MDDQFIPISLLNDPLAIDNELIAVKLSIELETEPTTYTVFGDILDEVVNDTALLDAAFTVYFNALLETNVCTNAVVAICVLFVVAPAVGAFGVPVNVGDASVA